MKNTAASWILIAASLAAAPVNGQESALHWQAGWQMGPPLAGARAGGAALTHESFIYVVGGVDGRRFLDTVEWGRIDDSGAVMAWQSGPALREPRGFVGAALHGRNLYAVGGGNGANGENLLRSVEQTHIRDDGSLDPWVSAPALNLPRRCVKVVAHDHYLYAIGGFGGQLWDSVERAPIDAEGRLGPWQLLSTKLMERRYVHEAKNTPWGIFVLGGHDENRGTGLTSAEWLPYPGSIGNESAAWRPAPALLQARYGLAAAHYGDTLYAIGGMHGANYLDSIEKINNPNQPNAQWTYTTPLSSPRAHAAVVIRGSTMYVIGGTHRGGYFNSVEWAQINAQGDLGSWRRAATPLRQTAPQPAVTIRLAHQGQIREVIDTDSYSFLLVGNDGAPLEWLAVARAPYAAGERIEYSEGIIMRDFFSKTLNRHFENIRFVGNVKKSATTIGQ